ncbi:hypothetical protein [Terrabacter sp. BE26]|uniref:hypothetical protein n=1 Tax=Terrabacter sp. BE26 TaxID=2898152 RepID=UPI0035BE366D
MNLTDLRNELTTHADDVGAAPDFRHEVATRVRRAKRRRAAAAGAATLAVAAVAAGVVAGIGRPSPAGPAGSATASASAAPMGSDGMPFRIVPDTPGDVVKKGLRYRSQVAGDTLAVGFIGDPGQGQFTLSWQPSTTHVSLSAECYLPGLTQDEAAAYLVTVGLDGSPGFFGSSCSGGGPTQRDLPAGGSVPGEPGRGWTELTVGKAASVRVRLVDAKTRKPAAVDGAQLAGAVYEQGLQHPVLDESGKTVAMLPDMIEHQGYTYSHKLGGNAPLNPWQDLTMGVPPGPAIAVWGSAGDRLAVESPGDGSGMRLTRTPGQSEERGYGSWGSDVLPADQTLRLSLSTTGARPTHGVGFLEIYTLEP